MKVLLLARRGNEADESSFSARLILILILIFIRVATKNKNKLDLNLQQSRESKGKKKQAGGKKHKANAKKYVRGVTLCTARSEKQKQEAVIPRSLPADTWDVSRDPIG